MTVKFSIQSMAIDTFVPVLRTLSTLLTKGADHATAARFDGAVLVNARLAPDMVPLGIQVRLACDHARSAVVELAGQAPSPPDRADQTLDELKVRIDGTIRYLEQVPAAAFEGAEGRDITIPLRDPLILEMKGAQFLRDWSLPNFYFHVVTAYDILRHNGVVLGKADFLGHIGASIRKR